MTKKTPARTLLLLSGGKDSRETLKMLLAQGCEVHGLCISGREKTEEAGASQAAAEFNIPLRVVQAAWFSEKTWNPVKLIFRDLGLGFIAMRQARKLGAKTIACGVKPTDFETLPWLALFLKFGNSIFKLFGLQLVLPLAKAN